MRLQMFYLNRKVNFYVIKRFLCKEITKLTYFRCMPKFRQVLIEASKQFILVINSITLPQKLGIHEDDVDKEISDSEEDITLVESVEKIVV